MRSENLVKIKKIAVQDSYPVTAKNQNYIFVKVSKMLSMPHDLIGFRTCMSYTHSSKIKKN